MKAIFAALASAALLAAPMASISTPAAAQPHGGGGFHGGSGGFQGGRGGFHGAGGFRGGASHGGGFRGGRNGGWDDGAGLILGLPYGEPYYDDPSGYYDDPEGYDVGSYDDGSPACGSWSWDGARGRYEWIGC